MPILVLGVVGILVFLFSQKAEGSSMSNEKENRLYDLPDIDPSQQGGGYKRDYDLFFDSAADEFRVPFALMKAHAIAESSLNPRAFRDENPTKRTDRVGWASRGLCQLLWWPNSDRWSKYGYPDKDLASGEKLFEPQVNIRIAAQLIRANLNSCGGNLRDAVNMYNTGKKESQYKAPNGYTDKVIGYYEKLIKGKV